MMKQILILSLILSVAGLGYGFDGGDGSIGDPYQISTQAHLEAVNNDVAATSI
jgi:hypothetical protein